MKQVKIAYKEYKEKFPNRPPDEIDFGLGFRAALRWIGETCALTVAEEQQILRELQ